LPLGEKETILLLEQLLGACGKGCKIDVNVEMYETNKNTGALEYCTFASEPSNMRLNLFSSAPIE
jgi:hypothetical protein